MQAPLVAQPPPKFFAGNDTDMPKARDWWKKYELYAESLPAAQGLKNFRRCLSSDSDAEEWFDELPDDEKDTFQHLAEAFNAKYPKVERVKQTNDELEQELLTHILTEKQLGTFVEVDDIKIHAHHDFANKEMTLARKLKIVDSATYIGSKRRLLPAIIRNKVPQYPDNWTEFITAIKAVSSTYIQESLDDKKKDAEDASAIMRKELDEERKSMATQAAQLRTLLAAQRTTHAAPSSAPASPTKQIRTQLASTAISRFATPRTYIPNAPYQGIFLGPNQTQIERLNPTQKTALKLIVDTYPLQADNAAGRAERAKQMLAFAQSHPEGTAITSRTPVPLTVGTADSGTGECWKCGKKEPGHFGRECNAVKPDTLPTKEQMWRAIIDANIRFFRPYSSRNTASVNYTYADDDDDDEEYLELRRKIREEEQGKE